MYLDSILQYQLSHTYAELIIDKSIKKIKRAEKMTTHGKGKETTNKRVKFPDRSSGRALIRQQNISI